MDRSVSYENYFTINYKICAAILCNISSLVCIRQSVTRNENLILINNSFLVEIINI